MNEEDFKKLFRRVVEEYELSQEVAFALLKRILEILNNIENDHLQIETNYEILTEHLKREELL